MSTAADSLSRPAQAVTPRAVSWGPLLWFSVLLVLCYAPVLAHLIWQWNNDDDMGHGFFVPAVAAYIAWQRKERLLSQPLVPDYRGLFLIAWGALQVTVATLGAELFLARTAFLISIVGCVLMLGGMRAVRTLAFPLGLLVFMVPIPMVIYNQITFPLQIFASRVAEWTLTNLFGIPVFRDGNILELPSQKLSVVEACSGIRSLLSLSFLSLVYAYFFDDRRWMRPVLLIATVPIAILANASRVTITGLMSEKDPELAKGIMHSLEGWVIFMVALVFLVVAHQVISRLAGLLSKRGGGGGTVAAVQA